MDYNHRTGSPRRAGFTLVEFVVAMLCIGVLAVPAAYLMMHMVWDSVFIPNQLNMDMLVSDAFDIMIEGDSQAKGLRNSREITAVAAYQVTFINQDGQTISYRLDTAGSKLYRSIDGAAEELIPYYATTGINLSGKSGAVFRYYDGNEAVTATPANVRWITMTLIAMTGTGAFADWEGQSEQYSGIAVYKFQ